VTSENALRTGEFAIRFKLRDADKINPWEESGQRSLSLLALTDGEYCIDLECTRRVDTNLRKTWCSNYVVRSFKVPCELWLSVREQQVRIDDATRHSAWVAGKGRRIEKTDDELYLSRSFIP
jgi:hypothetical protein